MEERLREAKSLEALLEVHDDFLDSCLKESMLTHPKLLKIVSKILSLSELFCEYFEVRLRFGGRRLMWTGPFCLSSRPIALSTFFFSPPPQQRFVRNAKLRAAGSRNPHVPLTSDEVSHIVASVPVVIGAMCSHLSCRRASWPRRRSWKRTTKTRWAGSARLQPGCPLCIVGASCWPATQPPCDRNLFPTDEHFHCRADALRSDGERAAHEQHGGAAQF